MITKIVGWGIVITLAVMFLAEQDWAKSAWQNTASWINPSPEQLLLEAEKDKKKALEKQIEEVTRRENIRQQTPTTRVIPLNPGQVVRVPVGTKYQFDCKNGEFSYSLLYQGHVVYSGFFSPRQSSFYTGNLPVDGIEFRQHPRYPYGELAILFTSN